MENKMYHREFLKLNQSATLLFGSRMREICKSGSEEGEIGENSISLLTHRLFSFISMNWRGKPLTTHEVIVNLIANTTTAEGLKVKCQLDKNVYQTGIKISKNEMSKINIHVDAFHGEWNYAICPVL